jgi:TIR domain/SIR2-like domain
MAAANDASLLEERGQVLLDAIQRRKCILLLGPGAAAASDEPKSKLLTELLAEELVKKLEKEKQGKGLVSRSDLAHVAQIYEREMPLRRPGLELAVRDFYQPYRGKTTQLHIDLAALPFTLGISTTPDRFFYNALAEAPDKTPIYEFYHFQPDPKHARERSLAPSPPDNDPEKHPLAYDLYGSLDEPDSLVLTENNLLDFLVSVARQQPAIHPYVSGQFSDPKVSFLFLGFGFRHWYVRILLHVLKAAGHEVPSLALEDSTFFQFPGYGETALFFESGHLLAFQDLPWVDFAATLRKAYEAQRPAVQKAQAVANLLSHDAPTAFLCHENRDKEKVAGIGRELERLGIKIWLDEQKLRGGDRWGSFIPKVLSEFCQYVIVFESQNMLDKPESYFWKEINYALERQRGFQPGVRFIVPVLLEKGPGLPLDIADLSDLQYVDITTDKAVSNLAQTIHEDWDRRPRKKS